MGRGGGDQDELRFVSHYHARPAHLAPALATPGPLPRPPFFFHITYPTIGPPHSSPQVGAGNISYQALYGMVSKALYRTHVEGKLKAEIITAPERYVELDPEMAQTLLDQKDSGKQLLLITNSDYEYTNKVRG